MQCTAEQGCCQKSILAVADVDERRREGGGEQQGLGPRKDRAHRGEIGCEARRYPDCKTQRIRKCRHHKCDGKEEWRIVPPEERHLAASKYSLLRRELEGRLVGVFRPSLPDQRPSRVHIGKISAQRLAVAI